jgi:DNA repair exonuclease SbcCD ATPase subunit
MATHTITMARFRDFKRLRDITITPPGDRSVIVIAGRNAQGKSSVLDALSATLRGKMIPDDPVRHGADVAELTVEFDGGKLAVHRVINKDGSTRSLEVRTVDGAVKSPQTLLDKLIGARFLDPLAFLALKASEQAATLLKLIDREGRIAELDAKSETHYQKRLEGGRDLTKAKGELARLPEVGAIAAPIDVAALAAEARELAEKQRRGDAAGKDATAAAKQVATCESAVAAAHDAIAELERKLASARLDFDVREHTASVARDHHAKLTAEAVAAADEWRQLQPRREQVDADLARASEHNRAIAIDEASAKRRAEVAAEVSRLEADYADRTAWIEKIDARKAEILTAAKLPVPELGVTADGITLGGVPLGQASGAERLRVALALAIAASPGLADVWIRDGALLDDDSMRIVEEHAASSGHTVWIERVGDADDPCAIVISDGLVISATAPTTKEP